MKEDRDETFACVAVVFIIAITVLGPAVYDARMQKSENLGVAKYNLTLPQMTLTVPDYSPVVDSFWEKEAVNERLDQVRTLMEMVDSLKPEAETLTKIYVGEFYLTMYAATIEQCGSTSGITASGRYCTDDPTCHTVAVDPKVIPLGTYLMIEGYDGIIFRADDTGSAVKGNHIDIFTTSEAESKSFPNVYGAKVWIVEV